MASATQDQVRRAIEQSNATGTAAEVLATITALSVERSNSDLQTSRALTIAIGPEAAATALGGLKAAAATNPLFDSMYIALSSTGLDFAYPMVQQMIDQLVGVGVFSVDLGAVLKGLGRWQESPLEVAGATRGLTTDEATVQAVLDTITVEASVAARREIIRVAYNSAVIVLDNGGTLDDVKAIFVAMGN